MGLRSFFGILPPKLPYATVTAQIETLPPPSKVTILWADGSPGDVAVGVGDRVRTGQNLARKEKGCFVSTVTGRIEHVDTFKGPDGMTYAAVTISSDSRVDFDRDLVLLDDASKVSPVELRTALRTAGFTSLSAVERDPSLWPSVDALVVSALDMDPLSLANQQTFRDRTRDLEAGIQLLKHVTGASVCILAVPKHLVELARQFHRGNAEVVLAPPVYPNGLPEILARKCGAGLLMKRKADGVVGNTLVVGVEHAVAMAHCLKSGRPLTEKVVTVSSSQSNKMRNVRVPIGTHVAHILQSMDMTPEPGGKVILDGPMRGYACFSDEQPVTAFTESIHVQAPSDIFRFENTPCTNCGHCSAVCPVDLEANLLARFSEYAIFEKCNALGAENCIACGLCAYVCPARRPLVQLISHAKHVIATQAPETQTMQEAIACDACGPVCPAIRLFETMPQDESRPEGVRQDQG